MLGRAVRGFSRGDHRNGAAGDGLLRYLLLETMDRGLAVYDIELFRLYDPRGRVDVEVSLTGDLTLPYLTPALLRDLVLRPTWPDPEHPYFIVARGDQEFIQTYRDEDGTYQLEHQDGGLDAHFAYPLRQTAGWWQTSCGGG